MTNQTQPTDPNDQNVVEFGDSPGRRLRVQRQSRGLAIERIASQLHLKPEIIEALEQDRFDLLPDPVFITGYLRNYARMLGVDSTPLIAAYQAHARTPKGIEPTRPIPGSDRDSGGTRILVRLVSLALAAAVVAMIALWWHDRPELTPELGLDTTDPEPLVIYDEGEGEGGGGNEGVASPAPEIAEQTPEAVTESTRTDRLATPAPPEPPIAERSATDPDWPTTRLVSPASIPEPASEPTAGPVAETASTQITTAATPDVEAPTSAPEPTTAPATKGIVLEFAGPSWLEVRDAAGQRLIVGEMKAGDRREVTGQAPFRFTVGRVNNSSMTVDGKPFDLEARSRGNVARFSFDPASPE
ncbi:MULTISPECIES: RodZ domain-containing protein [unclassified Thiocapsa]|uniref:RodZ domain-containing protein n=1 Tax=unclassified Thiocapsa TaxID=2641286 RepID=UPI0035B03991